MAILDRPIPDVDHTVLRYVVLSVMQDFIDTLRLPLNTKIIYPGRGEEPLVPNSTIGQHGDPKDFGNRPSVRIEVRDRLVEEDAGQLTQKIPENRNILMDERIGVYMRPHYQYHEVELTIRAVFENETAARQWADNTTNLIKQGRQLFIHKGFYHYRFDPVHMAILKEIHRLRENVAGYGEDFDTWFNSIKGDQVTELATSNAGYREYVVSETMNRIQGNFGFVIVPDDSEARQNKTSFEITIPYVFNFDKIDSMVLTYPIIVHNQVLSSKYRQKTNSYEALNIEENRSQSLTAAKYFEAGSYSYYYWRSLHGVPIPSYDDFLPKYTALSTRRIFTGLVNLSQEAAGAQLVDLNNLGRYKLHPAILAFIRLSELPYLTTDFDSVFLLHLYKGGYAIDNRTNPITIDDNLVVRSNRTLSFRDQHRVRLSVVGNLRYLSDDGKERLRHDKEVLCMVLHALIPEGPWEALVCNKDGPVTRPDFDHILDIIDGLDKKDRVQFNTVSFFTIESHLDPKR